MSHWDASLLSASFLDFYNELCSSVLQGSLSRLPRSCWTAAVLQLLWTCTSTRPTRGWRGRRTPPSASWKPRPRPTSKVSSEAWRANWGARWLLRLSEQTEESGGAFSSVMSDMFSVHFSFFLVLLSRDEEPPVEMKPRSPGRVRSLQSNI